MADCQFCRIISGERTATVLYQDERTTAFLDAEPAVEGHTLVAPNDHIEELFAPDHSANEAIFHTVKTVALAIDRSLSPEGFSSFYTSGDLVGTVDHAHVHLLPRTVNDGIRLGLARQPLDEAPGKTLADRIRAEL